MENRGLTVDMSACVSQWSLRDVSANGFVYNRFYTWVLKTQNLRYILAKLLKFRRFHFANFVLFCFTFVLFSFRFCVCFNESYHSLSSTYVRHCKSLPLKEHFWRKRGTFTLSAKITGACLYTRRSITKSFSWSY